MVRINQINHVAILVDDLESALSFWRDALGLTLLRVDDNSNEKAKVAFLPIENSQIELVIPTSDDSGLARQLEKRGSGLHHICLEVDDIEAMISHLKSKGVQLITQEPKVNEAGQKYVFIHPKSAQGVLVELYELPKE